MASNVIGLMQGDGKVRSNGVEGRKSRLSGRSCPKVAKTSMKTGPERKREEDEEEEEEENSESEGELELPNNFGNSLNFSKKKLKHFPAEALDRMQHVQYLYLEGNKLIELPYDFFQKLSLLKWLDLRNNNLNSLPVAGLEQHGSLEVILLQGNRIRNIPIELATIPTLRGLQITGNPITNIPYEIISEGFQSVIKHLEKLRSQDDILMPVSDTILVRASTSRGDTQEIQEAIEEMETQSKVWDLDKLSQWRHFLRKKSENLLHDHFQHGIHKNQNQIQILQQPRISVSLRSHPRIPQRIQPFRCGVYNRNRHRAMASALRYLKMRKTRLGYKRKPITPEMIQEKAKQEAYRAQVREVLELQAKKIQRMRDKEILKNWRNHSRITQEQLKLLDNYQKYPSKNFADMTPFDVDPEFLNMLNREDLYKSLKEYDNRSKRKRRSRTRITALDLEMQINEIVKKLRALDTNDAGESASPRTKHMHMCNKMDKIMDIQKSLKSLQNLNSTLITPVMKAKPKT